MISVDNPHREVLPFCMVEYWQESKTDGSVAVGKNDEWTYCQVRGRTRWPTYPCTNKVDRDNLIHFLNSAYEYGRKAKSEEFKQLLGIQ